MQRGSVFNFAADLGERLVDNRQREISRAIGGTEGSDKSFNSGTDSSRNFYLEHLLKVSFALLLAAGGFLLEPSDFIKHIFKVVFGPGQ